MSASAMPRHVDGFIVPVPKRNIAAHKKLAHLARRVWIEHGALEYHEAIADDVKPGRWTSFPRAVKLKPDETVWFSWIVYRSRRDRDRDRVNAKVMADPRLASMMDPKSHPFDGKRFIRGGFRIECRWPADGDARRAGRGARWVPA